MNLDEPFVDVRQGPIPYIVPFLRRQSLMRYWAGDDVFRQRATVLEDALSIFKERGMEAAKQRVQKWGNTFYNVPVLVLSFEDCVKIQKESGLLQGIEGVTNDGAMVAVNADYVRMAVAEGSFEEYFKVTLTADVIYGFKGNFQRFTSNNVVLFPYNGVCITLNADQFNAVGVEKKKRGQFEHGQDVRVSKIIENDVVGFPWSAILPSDAAVPLVKRTSKFSQEVYGYDTSMGLRLPSSPSENVAEGRALCAGRLDYGSRLVGDGGLGGGDCRLAGVVAGSAEGAAKK